MEMNLQELFNLPRSVGTNDMGEGHGIHFVYRGKTEEMIM